ncbi:tRNA uridine-5-carboxymethylaminomethyl(34) synthesis GTPase MnmE [Sphingomonas sp.]|uniref:tRNA uridine-5-carboxymethylaminomethyl(34) synthesis GTPase MnmE n=1 Tax=Sphingomonas sp. TaxID=28214 RepID=UPI002DEF3787|nr:tRNA uridine-5-carboxymethylaminomethyl(34) synthesis GTPase MnmE [Sphingomonas sp.]HEV2569926.1 tRNA uridine-5-carboxymethylaminomethyl(34) synthesis GTPase MnmE [Sphingomonas sp.]
MTDTIFALSSGAPPAAIAVIRISGPAAFETAERLAGPMPAPRALSLRTLKDAEGGALDRALVACFPASGSVTGEPLVELHLHGGRATVEAVEEALARCDGVRRARAGEFTWRAFENGKMDLVQVEALSDLLRAETEAQRRAALAGEGLSADVERWRRELLMLSALVEAAIDQSDEDDVPADRGRIEQIATTLLHEMAALLERPGSERLFEGVRVVFAGPPNAGKSSIINVLAGREVAITSPLAGTTRDVIEAPVRLGGVAFVFTDTAGIREASTDPIEQEGITRATRRIADADVLVWMGDEPPPLNIHAQLIPIHPRADEAGRERVPDGRLSVSAKTGEGLSQLTERLIDAARKMLPREGEVALGRRQRLHVVEAHQALAAFMAEHDELIAAEHLRSCRTAFNALTGRAGTEEMLDALFGTFCIGK